MQKYIIEPNLLNIFHNTPFTSEAWAFYLSKLANFLGMVSALWHVLFKFWPASWMEFFIIQKQFQLANYQHQGFILFVSEHYFLLHNERWHHLPIFLIKTVGSCSCSLSSSISFAKIILDPLQKCNRNLPARRLHSDDTIGCTQ